MFDSQADALLITASVALPQFEDETEVPFPVTLDLELPSGISEAELFTLCGLCEEESPTEHESPAEPRDPMRFEAETKNLKLVREGSTPEKGERGRAGRVKLRRVYEVTELVRERS